MLARLVSTAASISAGALLARRDPSRSSEPVPAIVGELLRLVAETICVESRPDAAAINETEAHISSLVERYGTMRPAVEAIASGGRRFAGVSHEKAHAWSAVMLASVAQIDSVLRRFPALMLTISKWIAAQGDTLEARLDAYHKWLDSPVSIEAWGTPESELSREIPSISGVGLGLPESQEISGDEAPASLAHTLVDAKRVVDSGGAGRGPRFSNEARSLAEHLASDARPYVRCLAAVILGRFTEADALLPGLRGTLNEPEFWSLWGERYYFEGRFEEAVEAFSTARAARDDIGARRNLAAAHMRATRPVAETHLKSAIDLLTDTVRSMPGSPRDTAVLEIMLGAAWMRYPGGDRDADLRRAIEHLESAISNIDQSGEPQWWAEAHIELGMAWLGLPSGKQLENVQRAITCFERAMLVWTRESDPERWAIAQNHLGHAWERLPAGERGVNLERAIACYSAAAEERTPDRDPVGWAMIQNNLGNAWVQVPSGDRRANILRAVECHQQALEIWSSHNRRNEWAATQNNLGIALSMLPADGEERERNLRLAISAYKSALEVRSRAAHPLEWASTQNNLGSTYLLLPPSADGTNLKEAIACFQRALEVRTRETLPIDWAKTQANLGNAWMKMPGDRVSNLQHAVECYNKALVVFTRASHPHQHDHISQKKAEAMDLLDDMQIMGRG